MSEQEQELTTYEVQRKVITWETQTVQASSFEEAIDIAEDKDDWDETYDQTQPTETYWVSDVYGNEAKIRDDHENWEDA